MYFLFIIVINSLLLRVSPIFSIVQVLPNVPIIIISMILCIQFKY